MTDIASSLTKIQVESVQFRSAVSEAIQQQIGAGLNYLVDFLSQVPGATTVFTSSTTYTVPATVHLLYVEVVGGGGGGGGGGTSSDFIPVERSGVGGSGSIANKTIIPVTPGSMITVTVGAGGAGGAPGSNGATGGSSAFGSITGLHAYPGVGHNGTILNTAGLRGPVLGGSAVGEYGLSWDRYDGGSSGGTSGAGGGAGPGGNGGAGGGTTGTAAAANTGAGGGAGRTNAGSGAAGGSGYVKIVVLF